MISVYNSKDSDELENDLGIIRHLNSLLIDYQTYLPEERDDILLGVTKTISGIVVKECLIDPKSIPVIISILKPQSNHHVNQNVTISY